MDGKVVAKTGHTVRLTLKAWHLVNSASGCEQAGTDVKSTSIGSLQEVIVPSTDSEKTLVRLCII
jgi:hypothetical protein